MSERVHKARGELVDTYTSVLMASVILREID